MIRAVAILNPAAAGGGVRQRWPAFEQEIRRHIPDLDTRWTEGPWHAAELTKQALSDGVGLVVAVGGDGTIHEAVNGFLDGDRPLRPGARLAYVPMGTGGDFQRTVRVPEEPAAVAESLAAGHAIDLDVGHVRFVGDDGSVLRERYFANLLSFGMGGDVSVAAKESVLARVGGQTAFFWATLKVFLRYSGKRVRLRLDGGKALPEVDITNVAVGNGEYHGGGMHPCPRASLSDGRLEVSVIERLSWFELLRDIRVLYSDDVYVHPKVHHHRAARLDAESTDEVRVEVDGEALGGLPIEVTVLPAVLPLVAPADAAY